MRTAITQPIGNWLFGLSVGTLLVAGTSPLFVRSYVPRRSDPVRGVQTYQPGLVQRWRSEGYATTRFGPHGMPGQTRMPHSSATAVVALYGDSQAEGFAVDDEQKLFGAIQRFAKADHRREVHVLPLARSGEDARDWLPQISRVQQPWGVTHHVLLIVDLPDLAVLASDGDSGEPDRQLDLANRLAHLPAFVIKAGETLFRDKSLRWTVGPEPASGTKTTTSSSSSSWASVSAHRQTDVSVAKRRQHGAGGLARRLAGLVPASPAGATDAGAAAPPELSVAFRLDIRRPIPPAWSFRPSGTGVRTDARSKRDAAVDWDTAMQRIREQTERPVLILYAPRIPEIVNGQVVTNGADDVARRASSAAERHGIDWLNVGDRLVRQANQGHWPHGFHNGQIGVGHLNANGYRVIAEAIANWLNR